MFVCSVLHLHKYNVYAAGGRTLKQQAVAVYVCVCVCVCVYSMWCNPLLLQTNPVYLSNLLHWISWLKELSVDFWFHTGIILTQPSIPNFLHKQAFASFSSLPPL